MPRRSGLSPDSHGSRRAQPCAMPKSGRPSVLLADSHEPYRGGLVRAIALHPGLDLIGVVDQGRVALSMIVAQRPDLAVLDARLPGLDGFEICEQLTRHSVALPTRPVLLMAMLDRSHFTRALTAGAFGCLGKELARNEICDALIAAARGEACAFDAPECSLVRGLIP